ncbi:YlbF family regulator [Acidaminobacter hydrogenoformans]|uniref:Cell fate regulator YlbF, YheA/YmcA/DUF963 family (Controls sporulation, competence, biofilm development) n=1 Tax=Acidaminobacter hydrogenoformans DSM 2784 TaxID=1120920 RepID=A0A1G5S5Y1_9FIRM|nr:YlbF family regulator [Acidaminobacter hydrogenoformans]SCZ81746.1 Cell fate regulator YlbF, YheA/YmcA/DUF963 family (controls sporulation, competence, biofilm development) [Acidaminobacter hydrogenoformans DSM 2784]
MNVYDAANTLAHAIKNSEEYKNYKHMETAIKTHEPVKKMIDDFHAKQFELQKKQLSGETPSEFEMKQLQKLAETASVDPLARDFLTAEMRFSLMMQDVSKILSDVMEVEKLQ